MSGQQVNLPALAEALEVAAGADTMGMTCVAALAGAAGAPAAANMGITAQHSTAQHQGIAVLSRDSRVQTMLTRGMITAKQALHEPQSMQSEAYVVTTSFYRITTSDCTAAATAMHSTAAPGMSRPMYKGGQQD